MICRPNSTNPSTVPTFMDSLERFLTQVPRGYTCQERILKSQVSREHVEAAFISMNLTQYAAIFAIVLKNYIEERPCYTNPQQKKKKESEQLRGERDKIKFIDLRFERWQAVGLRKATRRQDAP